ncbi:uncharacterized protein BDV14DRAFT_197108 [Aspergillus stella-maris]|uniref:uncharacterized protein n=1 Tax=Aspergillus stella-maris TaxID=1810926 RepID=UPI003CCD7D1C
MSQPTPQQPNPQIPNRNADFQKFKTYTAYTFLVASPILIALPPRKLDYLTLALGGAFAVSANHVTYEKSGRSIMDRIQGKLEREKVGVHNKETGEDKKKGSWTLPSERAMEVQKRLKEDRERIIREEYGEDSEEMRRVREQEGRKKSAEKGVVNRVWMGGEEKGWMERRLEEERKALSEGKGYGDLIKEHIWDVWSWGEKEGKDGRDRREGKREGEEK